MEAANRLKTEIRDLISQYSMEVKSRRKPWPESIQSRVRELQSIGFNSKRVSEETGIPYFSVLRMKRAKFRELTVTVPVEKVSSKQTTDPSAVGSGVATVTVATPYIVELPTFSR